MDGHFVGKELFGRPLRLSLALWALSRPVFFQLEAAMAVAYTQSAVRDELERFVRLGMLQRVVTPSDRRVYYTKMDSPLWDVIAAAERALRELTEASSEAGP